MAVDTTKPEDSLFAIVYMCKRLPSLSLEEYLHHYHNVHFHLAVKMPGILKYIQLPVRRSGLLGDSLSLPEYDSISVYVYKSEKHYTAAAASSAGAALFADTETFMDPNVMAVMPVAYQKEFFQGLGVQFEWAVDGL